jgi:hypothetical protein
MFRVTRNDACFKTCPKCRRPDKGDSRRKLRRYPENDGIGTAGYWDMGENPAWQDMVRRLEDR